MHTSTSRADRECSACACNTLGFCCAVMHLHLHCCTNVHTLGMGKSTWLHFNGAMAASGLEIDPLTWHKRSLQRNRWSCCQISSAIELWDATKCALRPFASVSGLAGDVDLGTQVRDPAGIRMPLLRIRIHAILSTAYRGIQETLRFERHAAWLGDGQSSSHRRRHAITAPHRTVRFCKIARSSRASVIKQGKPHGE